MSTYVQADRHPSVATPLGPDVLLLYGLRGREGVSSPFRFRLDLMAANGPDVSFERLLGQKVIVRLGLPNDEHRYFGGICSRVSEGHRDATFTSYRMDLVPQAWLLKLKLQNRIFQQATVPEILKQVLEGLDVDYQIRAAFQPRDYCVQYGETDFDFASRLMEEEGIYYFFRHTADGDRLVIADTPQAHPDLADPAPVVFGTSETGRRQAGRISRWRK